MSRRRPLHAIVLALGLLLLAEAAAAQSAPPLTATIFLQNPPADLTFDPALPAPPLTVVLQLRNASGASILTTEGFSITDFWRRLYFTHESGAIATNTAEAEVHGDIRVGFCLSRKGVLQAPTAIPVVPVEVVADGFVLEFTVDNVFAHFPDLRAPGRWTANARIPLLTYTTGGAIISDCDQFPDTTLANVGDAAGVSRQEFTVVSNGIEFFIASLDTVPPVVTPPASATVAATEAGGARGSASPALAAFLAGGSATDNQSAPPVRLAPQVAGVDVDNTTLFPLGITTVAFRYQDAAGNIGSATSTVTVAAVSGTPAIAVAIVGQGAVSSAIRYYDLRFTNTGTGLARSVVLNGFSFKTLSGQGNVTYNPGLSPKLPIALGDLASGASTTIRVYLVVPPAVKQFSMTETGQLQDPTGATKQFSSQQVVTP